LAYAQPAAVVGLLEAGRLQNKKYLKIVTKSCQKYSKIEAPGLQNERKIPSGVPKCGHGAPEVIFGAILAPSGGALGLKRWPKGGQNGAKNSQKYRPKSMQFLGHLFWSFWRYLGSQNGAFWEIFCLKNWSFTKRANLEQTLALRIRKQGSGPSKRDRI